MSKVINRYWRRLNGSTRLALLVALACLAGAALIVLAVDSDNDGMSDEYEQFFYLNPTNAADAVFDYDGDALTNLQESALWTDPFESDTDADEFLDGADDDPLSRIYIRWGDPAFTYTNAYLYTGPEWWLGADQEDGAWVTNGLPTNQPSAWRVAAGAGSGLGRLHIEVDRALLTNNTRLALTYADSNAASLYVDLADSNALVLATNLFGNLITGTNGTATKTLNIPWTNYLAAMDLTLRRGTGAVTVYESRMYIDQDGDGLDLQQEQQLGTSDQSTDSDGDGLTDYAEVFVYGSDPLTPDHTHYVSPSGGHISPYVSWATAATNIQAAINVSPAGDLVMVTNGTYSSGGVAVGGGATNRVALTNAITVRSVNGPEVTIIQGAKVGGGNGPGAVRCAYLTNGASLIGFTLTNGATKSTGGLLWRYTYGGGVACEGTGAVVSNCVIIDNISSYCAGGAYGGTLRDCTIMGNTTWWQGGGAGSCELDGCLVTNNYAGNGGGAYGSTFRNCVVAGNAADTGGGVMNSTLYDSTLAGNAAEYDTGGGGAAGNCTLSNCLITANDAEWGGGGGSQGDAVLYDCTLVGNSAGLDGGGGTYGGTLYRCTVASNTASGYSGGGTLYATLYNCVLRDNSAAYGGGASGGKLYHCTVVSNTAEYGGGGTEGSAVTNSIVYYNTASSGSNYSGGTFGYSCSTPLPSGPGNVGAAPQFVNLAARDLHLVYGSPCIDAATNLASVTNDIEKVLRPQGGGKDMGAYEFPVGTISGTVSYSGTQTGTVWVVAVTNADSWSTVHSRALAAPGVYAISNLPLNVSYWVKGWRDSSGNGSNDLWEAHGSYASNPVTLTNNVSGVNLTLSDPGADVDEDGMPDLWEVQYFGNLNQTAAGDYDGDGTSNLDEYLQGRDPTKGWMADTNGVVKLQVYTPLE